MSDAVQAVKDANPGFKHHLFDDNDCREFIKHNFEPKVLYAFDCLIPGAFKADLWRYCVLYINGGIYLDIKFKPINGFSFESLMFQEQFCSDRPSFFINGIGIYNGVMIVKAGNPHIAEAIIQTCRNCLEKQYTDSCLGISGPELLGNILKSTTTCKLSHIGNDTVRIDDIDILVSYDTYRSESTKLFKHYHNVWLERAVYKDMVMNIN